MIYRIVIFFFGLLIVSCNMFRSRDALPGKIVKHTIQGECLIYNDSDTPNILFRTKNNEVKISSFLWFNMKDGLIGTETINGRTAMNFKGDIVEFDLSGNIHNRIYEGETGEVAWPFGLSKDDKYLAFTRFKYIDPKLYPFEGLAPMVSLIIMDIKQKKIVARVDSIGRMPNFDINESPWIYNAYKFVYSIESGTKIILESDRKIINPVGVSEGVYLFNIISGERRLIVPEGYQAIASPTANQIAYRKHNSIRVLDLNSNVEKTIYTHRANRNILNIHWTPDGNYIYLAYTDRSEIADVFNTHGEELINVKTGKEKLFKSIGLGFESFTWK